MYYSPLIFGPTESLTTLSFQKERADWGLNNPVVEKSWSLYLHTLEGHTSGVNSIAWSPDGSRLASASGDKTVRIWNPATGQSVSTLHIDAFGFLQFAKVNSNHLHTSTGTFDLGVIGSVTPMSHGSSSSSDRCGYGLSDDFSWVTYNGVNLLWLPAEYRPSPCQFAMSATNLAIACSSGRIIFLGLTGSSPIIGL